MFSLFIMFSLNPYIYPIILTIFAKIFNNALPKFSTRNSVPHLFKSSARHIRMTINIVRGTNKLFSTITCHFNKLTISKSDNTSYVCFSNHSTAIIQNFFIYWHRTGNCSFCTYVLYKFFFHNKRLFIKIYFQYSTLLKLI